MQHLEERKYFNRGYLFELLAFLVYLVAFTTWNILFRDSTLAIFGELWQTRITAVNVESVDTFWELLEGPVLGLLVPDDIRFINGSSYLSGNKLIHGIRLRQLRVQSLECRRHVVDVIYNVSECYTRLTLNSIENKWVSTNGMVLSTVPQSLQEAYAFKSDAETDDILYAGNYGLYPGSGFVFDLKNYEDASKQIPLLREYSWVDSKTRGVFIDCAFYNSNLEAWLVSRIVAEFLPSGVVKCMYTVRYLQIDYWTFERFMDYVEAGLEGLVAVMTAFFLLQEIIEIAVRRLRYFKSFWNLLELTIIVMLSIIAYLKVKDTLKMQELLADPISITSPKLQNLAFWVDQENNLLGVVTLLLWLKLVKYAKGTKRLVHLSLAMELAGPDLLNFSVLLVTCLVGFAFSAVVLFSDELATFATFLGAVGFLLNAIFGNFDADLLYAANRVVGVPFILTWLLVANSLLLNFCIAILTHHYAAAFRPLRPLAELDAASLDFGPPLLPPAPGDDASGGTDSAAVRKLGGAGDPYRTDLWQDEGSAAGAPRKSAWEEQEARPAHASPWQQLQLLEELKLQVHKVAEAQEATAAKLDLLLDRLDRLTALPEPSRGLPGQVPRPDDDDDAQDPNGGSGEGAADGGRGLYARDTARARARIGGVAGKSLAPDRDA